MFPKGACRDKWYNSKTFYNTLWLQDLIKSQMRIFYSCEKESNMCCAHYSKPDVVWLQIGSTFDSYDTCVIWRREYTICVAKPFVVVCIYPRMGNAYSVVVHFCNFSTMSCFKCVQVHQIKNKNDAHPQNGVILIQINLPLNCYDR